MIRWMLILLFLFAGHNAFSQDARQILRKVNSRFSKVKEYEADVNLKTDISFVKILPVKAKIYFKQPYKMRIKSTAIALLPRQGFDQVFKALADTNAYVAMYQGKDPDEDLDIINIIPVTDTTDLVLGRFWVDDKKELIKRSQVTSKSNGTIQSEYYYGIQSEFALPDSLIITVDTRKFKIPKAISADLNNYNSKAKDTSPTKTKGKVYMRFSNYRINKGIPETVFKD